MELFALSLSCGLYNVSVEFLNFDAPSLFRMLLSVPVKLFKRELLRRILMTISKIIIKITPMLIPVIVGTRAAEVFVSDSISRDVNVVNGELDVEEYEMRFASVEVIVVVDEIVGGLDVVVVDVFLELVIFDVVKTVVVVIVDEGRAVGILVVVVVELFEIIDDVKMLDVVVNVVVSVVGITDDVVTINVDSVNVVGVMLVVVDVEVIIEDVAAGLLDDEVKAVGIIDSELDSDITIFEFKLEVILEGLPEFEDDELLDLEL